MPAFLSPAITVPASYNAPADVSLLFQPDTLVFHSISGGGYYYSFDGVNDHGMMGSTETVIVLPTKRTQVWFKQISGAASARVSATTVS